MGEEALPQETPCRRRHGKTPKTTGLFCDSLLTRRNVEPGMGIEPTTFALQAPLPPFRPVGLRSLQWRSPAGMTLRRSGRWGLVGRRCDAFVSFS